MLSFIFCLIISLGGCRDYGYCFHFSVDGGNGIFAVEYDNLYFCRDSGCELNCDNNSYLIRLRGGKNGARELTFTAIPEKGYQVKEWVFNDKIVAGNKTNTYVAIVTSEQNYNGKICVRFEPVQ